VPHPQLDLMASQRIPTVIELFAQRRVKIPGCHFFVAQPLAVHLFERRLFFGVGQEYAFGNIFGQVVRVPLPDLPRNFQGVGSREFDGLDIQAGGDKNRRFRATHGGWDMCR